MKALREAVSITQSIHNLGAIRVSGQRHAPTALPRTGVWVVLGDGKGYGNSRPHRVSGAG